MSANSESGEDMGSTAQFESAPENGNVLHRSKVNDKTRNNIPVEVSYLSVPEIRFDRQTHTHHTTNALYPF